MSDLSNNQSSAARVRAAAERLIVEFEKLTDPVIAYEIQHELRIATLGS